MRERKSHYNDHDDDVVLIPNESLVSPLSSMKTVVVDLI